MKNKPEVKVLDLLLVIDGDATRDDDVRGGVPARDERALPIRLFAPGCVFEEFFRTRTSVVGVEGFKPTESLSLRLRSALSRICSSRSSFFIS